MFQNQSEHYWCILFRLNRPDGIKYVQSHYIVVMRTKYCRPLSKPKSVSPSYWESDAEQTYLLLFTQTKGNVWQRIPGGEISQIKWYCTWDSLIISMKYQFPAARELKCAPEAKADLQSSVMEPTATLTFQYKRCRRLILILLCFWPKPSQTKGCSRIPCRRSLWDRVTCGRERMELFGSFPDLCEILIFCAFSWAIPLEWNKKH